MSFVYAAKNNDTLDIMSDTKITLDGLAGASFSKEQIEAINNRLIPSALPITIPPCSH